MSGADALLADVAVITGGGTGIGLAVAEALVARGGRVVLAGRRPEVVTAAADGLNGAQSALVAVPAIADVTDAADVASAFAVAEASFGPVGLLVNSAGSGNLAPIDAIDEREWDAVFAVCAKAPFLAMREFVRRRAADAGPGAIVNISSINGAPTAVTAGHATYSAAKAALDQLTRVAAVELGARGIRVNGVAPGATRTPMFSDDVIASPMGRAFVERTPLGRIGEPQDVAAVVTFLCSNAGSWLTGEILAADGGTHLRGLFSFLDVLGEMVGGQA